MAARYPQVEYMIAGGLGEMAVEKLMHRPEAGAVNWQAKSVQSMLGLTRDELGRIKAKGLKVTSGTILPIRIGRKWGQKVKLEDAISVMERVTGMDDIRTIKKCIDPYGKKWGVMKILRYLARQGESRRWGVPKMWLDYMGELSVLGGMEDERTVFPKNLIEAHAQASMRIKVRESEADEKLLQERMDKLREKYFFEAEGLVLSPFESLAEVIAEGQVQSICIGSYAKRYAQGGCDLCKLRQKDAPGEPWHAVEFGAKGAMYQCRGYKNMTDEEDVPRVTAFWQAWDKAHGTQTRPGLSVRKRRQAG